MTDSKPARRNLNGKGITSAVSLAKPTSPGRHEYHCRICSHPKRVEIEQAFVTWNSPARISKEYGVSRDFIMKGIRAGKLEYREGSIWGNPYLRVLRSQLERYIAQRRGSKHLADRKSRTELRKINKEIAQRKKELTALQARKAEIEGAIGE